MPAEPHLIESQRLIAAPRELIWKAFSDPVALMQWWGPKGFTNTFHEFDFRPGGAWRFTMHGPDNTAYAMDKQFAEIVPPEKIVLRHHQQGHDFTMTISLTEQSGQTAVVWQMHFVDPAEADQVRAIILSANEQNFDRLEAHLLGNLPPDLFYLP